ncbi:MupG family TIM beta-alpha barrel fold protein [Mammaliicoccus fleurettii]|uniref:MupG family TIM beta-alpha barrel fold protein n=1 Tax=Mammaliicoccus fleurettii TaxID=150056 RepID=UPI002DBF1E68|nr:MupG family TIM beta-alpha barrel fold protein [Mammaliicoccus fleurettii]MEB7779772.1 MupG family TIM beta-alpha barrel fold protein [Mammaliicoccus fleurettii]
MLGFSVYLGESFDRSYIETMLDKGFRYVFTSLQIPEEDSSQYFDKLKELKRLVGNKAEIIADASPHAFSNLGLSYKEPEILSEIGIDYIRLDISLELSDIISLLDKVKIVCNASTDAIDLLNQLQSQNVDMTRIMVAHNYYPRPETGLDKQFFINKNEELKVSFPDVSVMAFVPGTTLRGPVYQGLPTLEDHRKVHPLVAAKELLALGVDDICIGDTHINQSTINQFNTFFNKGIVSLQVQSETKHLDYFIGRIFHNRKDKARDVIRAEEARQTFKDEVMPENTIARKRGAITLDNVKYGRYMNELQIVNKSLNSNKAVNVIGHVCEQDLACIDLIDAGTAFQFVEGEE